MCSFTLETKNPFRVCPNLPIAVNQWKLDKLIYIEVEYTLDYTFYKKQLHTLFKLWDT